MASVVAVLLAAGGIATAVAVNSAAPSASPELPALPSPLSEHLDDLWKEVGP